MGEAVSRHPKTRGDFLHGARNLFRSDSPGSYIYNPLGEGYPKERNPNP